MMKKSASDLKRKSKGYYNLGSTSFSRVSSRVSSPQKIFLPPFEFIPSENGNIFYYAPFWDFFALFLKFCQKSVYSLESDSSFCNFTKNTGLFQILKYICFNRVQTAINKRFSLSFPEFWSKIRHIFPEKLLKICFFFPESTQ